MFANRNTTVTTDTAQIFSSSALREEKNITPATKGSNSALPLSESSQAEDLPSFFFCYLSRWIPSPIALASRSAHAGNSHEGPENPDWLASRLAEKALGILVEDKLSRTQWCVPEAMGANHTRLHE